MSNLKQGNKVCAIIPFYNEISSLKDVVQNTLLFVDKVFAVNDGSSDDSEKTIEGLKNIEILTFRSNCGKGFALQKGFDKSIEQDFDIIITIDADNQHFPATIPVLIENLNPYDIVIGNRLNDTKKMPLQRVFSNKITSALLSYKTKQKILDSQCGFRAYKSKVLKTIRTTYNGYEAESEIIVKAASKGFKIGFVDIPTIYGGEKSKMNPVKSIIGFIKVFFK